MAQSLAQIYVHIVFSTKERHPFLRDRELREEMHCYLIGICGRQGSPSVAVGGVEDHVHLLCRLSPTLAVADLVRELKRDSSKWVKLRHADTHLFDWQNGYGAFSLSPAHVDPLMAFIADQERHHQTDSYQDELRRILRKYGVEYDERYLWD